MIKSALRSVLKGVGIGITRYDTLKELERNVKAAADLQFLKAINGDDINLAIEHLEQSKAQLRQDLFVLSALGFKRDGFFVEFGATNGVDLSNTHLLETEFGWQGILAEPGRSWHTQLSQNRRCAIDHRCVWSASGEEVLFNDVASPEFSTVDSFSEKDLHSQTRKDGQKYSVKTISLNDLLTENNAPKTIDYLSIDTEGSELDIILSFDFSAWDIKLMTIEHNFTANRDLIFKHLTQNGFRRVYEPVSRFDDWYVSKDMEVRV